MEKLFFLARWCDHKIQNWYKICTRQSSKLPYDARLSSASPKYHLFILYIQLLHCWRETHPLSICSLPSYRTHVLPLECNSSYLNAVLFMTSYRARAMAASSVHTHSHTQAITHSNRNGKYAVDALENQQFADVRVAAGNMYVCMYIRQPLHWSMHVGECEYVCVGVWVCGRML